MATLPDRSDDLAAAFLAALRPGLAQIGVPAPTPADGLELVGLAIASPGLASEAGAPPAQAFARARNGHGPPQAAQIRTTVLRL